MMPNATARKPPSERARPGRVPYTSESTCHQEVPSTGPPRHPKQTSQGVGTLASGARTARGGGSRRWEAWSLDLDKSQTSVISVTCLRRGQLQLPGCQPFWMSIQECLPCHPCHPCPRLFHVVTSLSYLYISRFEGFLPALH